jgi:hypothetical protein
MMTDAFMRSDMYYQLREHAMRENDATLHALLEKLRHDPTAWPSAESFLTDALLITSTQRAGLQQRLVEQAATRAPEYVPCTHCNPYAWK